MLHTTSDMIRQLRELSVQVSKLFLQGLVTSSVERKFCLRIIELCNSPSPLASPHPLLSRRFLQLHHAHLDGWSTFFATQAKGTQLLSGQHSPTSLTRQFPQCPPPPPSVLLSPG